MPFLKAPMKDSNGTSLVLHFEALFRVLKKYYGNPLHIAVYIRDLKLFNSYSTQIYLNEKFDGLTPIELAQKLGYTEFITGNPRSFDPITGEKIIKQAYLRKYLNPIKGYKTRLVKLTKDHLMSFSEKVTVINLDNAYVTRIHNKIRIQSSKRKLILKCGSECDEWYEMLINKEKRMNMVEIDDGGKYYFNEPNPYIFMFLIKLLVESNEDEDLKNLVKRIGPLNKYFETGFIPDKNLIKTDESVQISSSETDYDSCEEEFFDIESK